MDWHIFYLRMSVAIKVVCAQVVMLVLAWKLDAQSMGYFTLQEWLRGMGSLQYVSYILFVFLHAVKDWFLPCCVLTASGHVFLECPWYSVEQVVKCKVCLRHFSAVVRCDSTERLRNSLDYLRSVLNDSTSFKLIYRYAFDFARVSQTKYFSAKILSYRAFSNKLNSLHLNSRIPAGNRCLLSAPDWNSCKVLLKPMFRPILMF